MIQVSFRQLITMCAGHFMAYFDHSDLRHNCYETEYETRLADRPLRLWYRIRLSAHRDEVLNIDFELIKEEDGNKISIYPEANKYDVKHVLTLVNDYLKEYDVITIKNYDNQPDCY